MYFSFRDGPKENLLRGQRSYRKKKWWKGKLLYSYEEISCRRSSPKNYSHIGLKNVRRKC